MKILIVDDETPNRDLLREYLESEGFEVIEAEDGKIALDILKKDPDFTVILLDRMMPVMDGMQFMEQFKIDESIKNIPVVMQTAAADSKSIETGINTGVFYYLTKPYKKTIMLSIIHSAIKDRLFRKELVAEIKNQKASMVAMKSGHFQIKTLHEAQNLAYLLANSFPDPEKVVLGLSELIINAVEHGNLGINFIEKSELIREGKWEDELEKRLSLPKYKDKFVEVLFKRDDKQVKVTIKDQGEGFNWHEYIKITPSHATAPNGRGIFMAKSMSFDGVEYLGNGNEVECTVLLEKKEG